MSEREAVTFVLWSLAAMVAVGAALPRLWPGLVRLVDRAVLKEHVGKRH